MSAEAWLALLLDGPMQSWGHASRFERRTTALHPTRSALLGIVAAAMGIDKFAEDEAERIARFAKIHLTTFRFDKRDPRDHPIPIHRLEDYHTVTGIRRASGKAEDDATVQTYRHYLLDARFGVILRGDASLVSEMATALRDPKWGVWLGRKCCIPACPLLVASAAERQVVWGALLRSAGFLGTEDETQFDRVVDASADAADVDRIEDEPLAFGHPVGQRHTTRWVQRLAGSGSPSLDS